MYGTTRSCPGSSGSPAATQSSHAPREEVEQLRRRGPPRDSVVVRFGSDERGARPASAARIALGARRHLRAGCPHTDPDLAARLVQPVRVGPHERDRRAAIGATTVTPVRLARVTSSLEHDALREHGLRLGHLEPGAANAITDVPGVAVGHVTVTRDEPEPPADAVSRAPASRRRARRRPSRSSAGRVPAVQPCSTARAS